MESENYPEITHHSDRREESRSPLKTEMSRFAVAPPESPSRWRSLFERHDLSDDDKAKAIRSIDTAKDEVQADEPDKEFAAKSLQRATKVLKDAGETVEAGTSLWQKVTPILEAVSPWLNVAVG